HLEMKEPPSMFYAPPYSMPQGRFILSSTSGPDDAKLQARAGQLQAGSRPSAPAPMASSLRKGTPVRTLADIQRRRREIAADIARRRNISFELALSFVPQ
ncbi:MAG: hypothetical protein Q8K78_10635, partial [Planctomycetaceae bacterium]|nr:hypothetical protein [Planctomycetaceae bacterium]